MEAINTERIGKYLIEIYQDVSPESPREWDNLGTMVCFHRNYNLGDNTDYRSSDYSSWEELKQGIIENEGEVVILPLYLYDHSGITMSTSPFHCPWDSGQVGWIFVSKHKIKKEGIDESEIERILKGEVETYDQYLTGDVYGYMVYEVSKCDHGHEHKEHKDSCWGFYGDKDCMDEAVGVVEYYMKKKETV